MGERLFHVPKSAADKPYLIGSQCQKCQRYFFPKRLICPDCLEVGTMQEKPLSTRGKLYSYYLGMVAPAGISPPYAAGWIDLPEGVRVFGVLTGFEAKEENLKLGMEVELVLEKVGEQKDEGELLAYRFRPV